MRRNLIAAVSTISLMMAGAAYAQQSADQSEYLAGQPAPQAQDTPTLATPADGASVENMMGRQVVGSNGERIGSVEDVILNPESGAAEQLVISSGGFLGIGSRNIVVDFSEASLEPGGDEVRLANLTAEQAQELPEFEYDDTVVSLGRGNADQIGASPADSAPADGEPVELEVERSDASPVIEPENN